MGGGAHLKTPSDNSPFNFLLRQRAWNYTGCAFAVCCLAVCAGVVALVLVAVFVGGGSLAQTSLDDAGISITAMSMSNFDVNGFKLNLLGILDNRSPLEAKMHAATMTMSYDGQAVGSMTMPQQSLPAGATLELNVTQTVTVLESQKAAFSLFSSVLLTTATVAMDIEATVDLEAAGLTFK